MRIESLLAGGDCETVFPGGCLRKSTSTILRIVTFHPRCRPLLLIKQSRETPLSVRSRGALRLQGPKNPSVSSYGRTAPKICSVAAVPESPPLLAYSPARHCSVEAVELAIHQNRPACNVEIMKLSMLGAPRCNKGNHAPPGVPRTRSPAAQCSIAWPKPVSRNPVTTFCASSTNIPHLPYNRRRCVT